MMLTPETIINEKVLVYKKSFVNFCREHNISQDLINSIIEILNEAGTNLIDSGYVPPMKNSLDADTYFKRAYILEYIAYLNIGTVIDIDYFSYRFGSSSKFKNPLKSYFKRSERVLSLVNATLGYLDDSSATFITICGENNATIKAKREHLQKYLKRRHGGHYMRGFEVIGGLSPHYHLLYLSPDSQELVCSSIQERTKKQNQEVHYESVIDKDSNVEREMLKYLDKISTIGKIYDYINKIGRVRNGQKFAELSFEEKNANVDASNAMRTYGASRTVRKKDGFFAILRKFIRKNILGNGVGKAITKVIKLIINSVNQSIKLDKKKDIFYFWIQRDCPTQRILFVTQG